MLTDLKIILQADSAVNLQ